MGKFKEMGDNMYIATILDTNGVIIEIEIFSVSPGVLKVFLEGSGFSILDIREVEVDGL